MTRPQFGTFTGGIDLPDAKDATINSAIAPAGRLNRLGVPLAPVQADAARPAVRIGQYVSRGERLGEATCAEQVDVFAPLAGRVTGFCNVSVPSHPTGWRRCRAVELADLDIPAGIGPLRENYDWLAADEKSIRLRIAEGGLTTFYEPVVSLSRYIDSSRQAKVDTLIANVMENTPFITADHRLLAERGLEVVRGLAILARAVGASDVILAVDHRHTDAYRTTVAPARLYGISSIALAHKYPIGAVAMLIKVLTRRRAPPGADGLAVGVAVTDAATCHAAYRWVACGELPTARVITVSGQRINSPANMFVPFGADVSEVLDLAGTRGEGKCVFGSAMTGRQVADGAVTGPSANALLALEDDHQPIPTPCIRCGWCSDNCPARLNVSALNDDFELGRTAAARRHGAMACIECAICSYVCPARLPLMQRVRLLKQAIGQEMSNAVR
ncbi:MAG: hypothetical protein SVV80_07935 [Planctomycetota bacterium]|nr:hypothetical protein [Planctomycetota bacterium]